MRIVITYQHRGDDQYLKLIELAFASALRQGYDVVLVGDCFTQSIDVLHFPADKEPLLMNWVLAAQLHYIQSSMFDCDSVLFSPDALINKPLDKIFNLGFDCAFTDRKHSKWPINNGVIFLNPEKKLKLAALWKDCIAKCKTYDLETQMWFGDQQALYDVYLQGNHLRYGLDVRLLPCATFNASPAPGIEVDAKLIETAYIVHLKGQRKEMMQQYWDVICKE